MKNNKTDKTNKQKMFILEYLVNGFNGTQAAIKAGYSKKTANEQAARLLANVNIRDEINKEINIALDNKRDELKHKVIEEQKKIAFSDIKKIIEYDQDGVVVMPSSDVDTSVISQVEIEQDVISSMSNDNITVSNKKIKFKLYDKIKALDGLAKYLGIEKETAEITMPEGIQIVFANKTKQD
jgi:phage terminase small subunit